MTDMFTVSVDSYRWRIPLPNFSGGLNPPLKHGGAEGETKILYGIGQPLVGLIYDDDEMNAMDIYDMPNGAADSIMKNDFVYLFSYEFCK